MLTLAWFYATAMNHFFMSFGVLFVVQAFQASKALGSPEGQGGSEESQDSLGGLVEAARLLLGNFAMPFSETLAAAAFPADVVGIKVLGFWMPVLLGTMIVSTALLGHLSLKFRRAHFVVCYIALITVQLVWQVELSKVLRLIAGAEDLTEVVELGKSERLQSVPYAMFEAPYTNFVEVYDGLQCAATLPNSWDAQVRLECTGEGMESKVMQFVVAEFCRAWKPSNQAEVSRAQADEFGQRVEACKTQGREANILPERPRPRETVFCRCRSAAYDWLRVCTSWIMLLWCGELIGVCIVLYFVVESNLNKMDPMQRREVLGFAIVGMLALVGRVTIFAEYFDEAEVVSAEL